MPAAVSQETAAVLFYLCGEYPVAKGERGMVTNRKPTGRAMSMAAGLGLGCVINLLWTTVWAAVLAKLIESGRLGITALGWGAMAILITASFLGAMFASAKIKRRRLLVCIASGLAYYLLLIAITAMFFGGQYTGMPVTGAVVAAGCGAAALMKAGKGRRRVAYSGKRV